MVRCLVQSDQHCCLTQRISGEPVHKLPAKQSLLHRTVACKACYDVGSHAHRQILADKEAAAASHEDHEELEWWFDVEEGFQERCLSEKAWNAVAAQVCRALEADAVSDCSALSTFEANAGGHYRLCVSAASIRSPGKACEPCQAQKTARFPQRSAQMVVIYTAQQSAP